MIARVICKTCGAEGKIDIGYRETMEAAQKYIRGLCIQSCPWGHHIKMGFIEYEVTGIEEGSALSEEEFIADMKAKGYDLWTTEQLAETEIEITGFSFGFPLAKVRGQEFTLDFTSAPTGGRYYYCRAGAYASATK